jgi:hypothetical protein
MSDYPFNFGPGLNPIVPPKVVRPTIASSVNLFYPPPLAGVPINPAPGLIG